jgi:hypothetical protein
MPFFIIILTMMIFICYPVITPQAQQQLAHSFVVSHPVNPFGGAPNCNDL